MRDKQKARTRAAIIAAAGDLLRRGGAEPSLEDVAEAAGVSRATAYRYFPGFDALLNEAAGELLVPEPRDMPSDPFERLALLDESFDAACRAQEATLRRALASGARREPSRQRAIEQALAPLGARLGRRRLERLAQALAMVIGAESFLALNDVAGLDESAAREVRQWAIDALVAAALSEAYSPR